MIYRDGTPVPPRPMHLVKPPSRLVVASPSAFAEDPTVLSELIKNRYEYLQKPGDPTVNVRGFPDFVLHNAERLQEAVLDKTDKKIGINPVLHYLLSGGLLWFKEQVEINQAIKLRKRLKSAETQASKRVIEVLNGVSSFLIELELPRGKRKNFSVSQELHSDLTILSSNLKPSLSDFAVLAIMKSLADSEETTIEGHSTQMNGIISSYLESLGVRNRVFKAALDEFEL